MNPQKNETLRSPFFRFLIGLYLLSILTLYPALHDRYRPIDVDDPWYLSIYHGYSDHGIQTDAAFGDPHNGVQFFGKTHALLVGAILNATGWTRTNAHVLSILFIVLGILCWLYVLRRFGYSKPLLICFGLAALISDPFFTPATSSRPDAYCFMLVSGAFALFLRGNFFLSMILTWAGLETSPISGIVFFYMAAAALSRPGGLKVFWRETSPKFLSLLAGFLAGLGGYLALHYHALSAVPALLAHENAPEGRQAFGCLFEYFFRTKYYRHLPELALVLAAFWLYWKKGGFKAEPFAGFLLVILIASLVVLRRPNFHYTVFFYPALLFMMLKAFERPKFLYTFMTAFWCLMAAPYFYQFIQNQSYDLGRELEGVQTIVPNDGLPVVGPANEWFLYKDREFYYYDFSANFETLPLKEFYLLEDNTYRNWNAPGIMKSWLENDFSGGTVSKLDINGQTFEVRKMRRKAG